ncbi:uncharacterized protein LOC128553558, partial [Mercenaria mercenaria]|uniref:uncharacterized protein LOC128553558 n=1 Tax=Mercenaria mercenaria TaxID=6596 RepID=UPI00234EAB66
MSSVDSSSEGETKKVNKKIKIKELIESECGFTETLLAVFDSFQTEYVEEDDTVRYNVKLLEEDENGRTPGDQDFDETHHTVFHSLAEREHKEVINHPVVRALVDYKWTEWARNRFMLNVCLYLLGLFSLTFSVAVAATTDDVKTYNTGLQYTRAFFEVISYGTVIRSLILEISQVTKHQLSYCQIRFNCLEMATALILVLVLPVRYINTHLHWYIFGLGYMMWVLKIFKYAVVFSKTDAYIESLRKIFWEDLIPFSLLFCIVNLAFGGTFLLVSKGDDSLETHAETSSLYGIWYVGLRTLIEAQPVVEYTGEEGY